MPKGKTLTVEIFAVGKWNGMAFTVEDLNKMAETFEALKDVHRVPLKFGHNDEQQMTDGFPALGWVSKVWVDDGKDGSPKLMAEFSDVPEIVDAAMKKKLYKNVSIELDLDVKHMERKFDFVLSGVALLGADIPAVNTLADLTAYMGRDSLVASRREQFTAITTNYQREIDMDLQKQLDEMTAKFSKLEGENTALKADAESKADAEKTQAIKFHRETITAKFEKAVKEDKLLPAQRDSFSKIIGLDDDVRVMAVTEAQVDELIASTSSDFSTEEKGEKKNKKEGDANPSLELDVQAKKFQAERNIPYAQALDAAMLANPELASAHYKEED